LIITKKTRLEIPFAKQSASFAEAVTASSLLSEETNTTEFPSQKFSKINSNGAAEVFENLVVNIPQGFLPKTSDSSFWIKASNTQILKKNQSLPDIISQTKIVLVSDFDNENNFVDYNSNQRWPLASITKLMTAILAIEEIGKEKEIMPSENAITIEGNAGKLERGKLYKVEDLIKIMIITSSNHAAAALADFYIFGEANFVRLMNKKAADLSMTQTVFFDSTGLSPLNQSTANDIRKLMKHIINNHPEILIYSQEKSFGELKNINLFAGQNNFLGGKTGYLDEAKQNLVSLFSLDNRRVLIVVLGAENRFEQTQALLDYLR